MVVPDLAPSGPIPLGEHWQLVSSTAVRCERSSAPTEFKNLDNDESEVNTLQFFKIEFWLRVGGLLQKQRTDKRRLPDARTEEKSRG